MLRRAALIAAVFALNAVTLPAAAPQDDVLTFKAVETTLANGLKVIVVPTGFPNIVSIHIPVRTGSRNEVEPGKSGFAHFFEHMMFRGTKAYPPEAYQAIITRAGARQNAYTTDDYTNYHVTFAKEDLETLLRVEADRFENLSYSESAFQTESRAVLGEYNKNSADPIRKLLEVQRDHAFSVHTYKHTTMGFLADIEDMPHQYAYSLEFFDRWYRPEYTTLIVAGDVTPEEVLRLVEKYWGGWKRGDYTVEIPQEPPAKGPVVAHVPWESPTLPWISVAFHAPAFSDTRKDYAALDMLMDLTFGPTSELYKRLVEDEQKVDQMFAYYPGGADPHLASVLARVKDPRDAVAVRDAILRACAEARREAPDARRLADAQSNARYAFVRGLDNTEAIASTLARFVRYERSYDTLNKLYRVYASLTPEDLLAAARQAFTDAALVQTTLSQLALPDGMDAVPALASLERPAMSADDLDVLVQRTDLPQLDVKLLFGVGSAHDPAGKEGLAALAASMITEAGSRSMRIDEIRHALFPMAGSFEAQVDKEMTSLTARVHRDNWERFSQIVLPMLLEPGFRAEDFARLKDAQRNALIQDLRTNNEEELGKERLQVNLFAGTPYAHPVLGSVAGIDAITLDDVRQFVAGHYNRANLRVGLAGDVPDGLEAGMRRALAGLPDGPAATPPRVAPQAPHGLEVEIVQKQTRATAVSFGHPIEVTRSHPDFAALYLARTWLGEHRSQLSHLYQRIREVRGMNYGDYAYIEAFPRGMFQFFPDPNVARRAQIFEVWLRPLRTAEEGHMALRIALTELRKLLADGLSEADFEATRNYLMKNVYVMTATQDQQLGYALDSQWYGISEFAGYMRERLTKLTRDEVNRVVRKYLSGTDLSVVFVTQDAEALRERLLSDAVSKMTYDGEKPAELLAEDEVIGAMKLGLAPERVRITPVEEVFAR